LAQLPRPPFAILTLLGALAAAPAAYAADAERGRTLVQMHCAACHTSPASPRREVAEAPPFAAIARKYGHDASALSFAIFAPHAKMNFTPARADAADIAAYLSTLPR
jgi:mono/diheme cytochrome c family protein